MVECKPVAFAILAGSLCLGACGGDADEAVGTPTGASTSAGGGGGGATSVAAAGATTSASGGTTSGAGAGPVNTGPWIDISPPSSNGSCNAVVVNRLTGDLHADVNDTGVWKSTDQGASWERVDNGTVSGVAVMGPGFDVDQEDPARMAVWSLDGDAGWVSDGSNWKKMAPLGRNWDFGSTDWASANPKTMIGTRHEANGEVYLSTDGASSWTKLSITVWASGAGFPPPPYAMVGVMDATTLIYGDGDGIYRSTNSGASFAKVSDLNTQTRVPVLFKGVFYLGGEQGLVVSSDKGASWQLQGSAQPMWVGPFFGADESSMVVGNSDGVYKTSDAGTTWAKIAEVPPDSQYDPRIFGGFGWDPQDHILYAAALGKPVVKLQL